MAFTDRLANRGSISTASYDVEYSVLLDGQYSDGSINQTGGDRKTHTISFWHKRAPWGAYNSDGDGGIDATTNDLWGTDSEGDTLRFNGSDLCFFHEGGTGSSLVTDRKFRDCAAWYHFVVAIDTTQQTAANRIKIYVNGVQETDFSTETYPDEDDEFKLMQNGQDFNIGMGHSPTYNAMGYYADFYIIDGAALAPTEFGEFDSASGIWKPKEYDGDVNVGSGTNGGHYKFEGTAEGTGSGATGLDSSGEGNHINFRNQYGAMLDTPTNNFCVINNQANRNYDTPSGGLELGGCRVQGTSSGWATWLCTMPFSSGKWYFEAEDIGNYIAFGIMNVDLTDKLYEISGAEAIAYRTWNGGALARDGNADVSTGLGAPDSNNWVWGFWIDMDNGKFSVANRDGATGTVLDEVDIGDCFDNGRMVIPFIRIYNNTDLNVNFGKNGFWRSNNRPGWYASFNHNGRADDNGYGLFEYYPNGGPSGNNGKKYYTLCTKNLAEFG